MLLMIPAAARAFSVFWAPLLDVLGRDGFLEGVEGALADDFLRGAGVVGFFLAGAVGFVFRWIAPPALCALQDKQNIRRGSNMAITR